MPLPPKENLVRRALEELEEADGDELAAHINAKHGTKFTGRSLAQFMRYGVRNLKKRYPKSTCGTTQKIKYRLGC